MQKTFWEDSEVTFRSEKWKLPEKDQKKKKPLKESLKKEKGLPSTRGKTPSTTSHSDSVPCDKCKLHGLRKPVPPSGTGKLLFIGMCPGEDEDKEGLPFVGKSGKLLRATIESVGISIEDCSFANVVMCRLVDEKGKNRPPTSEEMKLCGKFVLQVIQDINPELIVLLGEPPLKYFFNKKLSAFRGLVLPKGDYRFFITFHPAHITRERTGSDDTKLFEKDFKSISKIFRKVEEEEDKSIVRFVCESHEDVEKCFEELELVEEISVDIESYAPGKAKEKNALNPWSKDFKITTLSISYFLGSLKKAFCIPLEHPESKLDLEKTIAYLKGKLQKPCKWKVIGQHIKWDLKALTVHWGFEIEPIYLDTLIAHSLLVGKRGTHNLERMSVDYLSTDPYKYDLKAHKGTEIEPLSKLSKMNMDDCINTMQLAHIFEAQLKETLNPKPFPSVWDFNQRVIVPGIPVLKRMEVKGMLVDRPYLENLEKETKDQILILESRLANYPEVKDKNYSLTSNPDLQKILFEEFGFQKGRKTKTGYAVDKEVFETLLEKTNHPFLNDLIDYKLLEKLLSTYISPYLQTHIQSDGRVHGTISQHVALTGRLSMEKPNLQNIPARIGPLILKAFICPPGHKLILADYSQMELRVLAAYSKDPRFLRAFIEGQDIHRATASECFGVPFDEVTKEQRQEAKSINFGIVYGMGGQGLADDLGWEKERAQKFIDDYLDRFHYVKEYISRMKSDYHKKGYVVTLFGRRVYIKGPDEGHNERRAVNSPIQGTASDINNLALYQYDELMIKEGLQTCPVNIIHDSGVYESPDEEVDVVTEIIKSIMENIKLDFMGDIPLRADMAVGISLGDAKQGE